ncbi:MAG TPA: lytic transglycosylase domain-containing protein [Bryobacteraceae bacterium]|jgi:soluble lytic murein transglycosylase-like protein|nr:lytic transglycosylase domain-containing protein [Bryobacteraceae bacterium]
MRSSLHIVSSITFLTLLAGPVLAQSSVPSAQDAAAKQRQAAAAMQDSLARQQASIQKQTGAAASAGFFVLPRAASLGGVTGSLPAPPPTAMAMGFDCDPLPAPQVESLVGETAEREGLSPDLLRSVMKQESGYRSCAVSSKGAMGLMQLMPGTAEDLGIANPFDAASNLDGGARFLKQLLSKYGGDVPKALGAYNAGPAKVDAAGTVPNIPETLDYVRQILAARPFH